MRLPQPYRILFPIGLTCGVLGAGVWPAHALGGMGYPGVPHRLLMIEGFEQGFVLGFLLTAMPGFTKGAPCHLLELAVAALASAGFAFAVVLGAHTAASSAFLLSMLLLVVAIARRLGPSAAPRPMELVFVGFGLLLGLIGAVRQLMAGGVDVFAGRLISLGMVLSLVLGLGSLLVPTFTGMRSPLTIPGVAAAHEAGRRLVLYIGVIGALSAAFLAEGWGAPRAGAVLRAVAATVMIGLVWKLVRLPGRRDAPAWAMWTSGWFIAVGLWSAALFPAFTLGALHIVFLGGFALLTLGIGTRVLVAHGQHPLTDERVVLSPLVVATVLLALVARLAAEWMPERAVTWLGISGGIWLLGWIAWAANALPRIAGGRPTEARETAR